MTRVVNLHKQLFDVYIGRAGHGYDGYFDNPGKTVREFENYFFKRLETDPEYKDKIYALKGKVLGCFCAPKHCHGDVIALYLNDLEGNQPT